jgi:hypothetical protein
MAAKKVKLQRAALEHHQQVGKELVPPFLRIGGPIEQVFWWRDLLPEFLWIDSLVQTYGEAPAVRVFSDFLSAADRFNTHPKDILDGTVSAFRFIAEDKRQTMREASQDLIAAAVLRPFGHVLSLYSQCPMAWMAIRLDADRNSSIESVRDAVVRLFPGKDPHAGFCRALPLHRLLTHHKIRISSDLAETIDAIKSYPQGDRYRAETFARTNSHSKGMGSGRRSSTSCSFVSCSTRDQLKTLATCVSLLTRTPMRRLLTNS